MRSRTRRYREHGPKMAFSMTDMAAMQAICTKLFRRALQVHPIPTITHDQFAEMFIRSEHREAFRIAAQHAKQSRYYKEDNITYNWRGNIAVAVTFKLHGQVDTMIPSVPELQEDAPKALISAVDEWLTTRLEIGLDWGRVLRVLNLMNERCKSAMQVRYLWPSVLALAKAADIETAAKIEEYKEPAHIPVLSCGLRAALTKTSGTIASALLLNDPIDEDYSGRVVVSCSSVCKADEPDLGDFVGM